MDQRFIKGEETRLKIIKAAKEIVANEGNKGLSAKKIADHAGISKSTVFHHFQSIDLVTEELFNYIINQTVAGIEPAKYKTLEEGLLAMGNAILDLDEKELDTYKVLFYFMQDVLFQEKHREKISRIKDDFTHHIVSIISDIEGKAINRDIGEMIAMDLDSIGLYYIIDHDREKFSRFWKIKTRMYIDYLNKDKETELR